MANSKLKKLIPDLMEKRFNANNPLCTKDTYEKQDMDYEGDDDRRRCAIGESLFREGKIAEAYEYYEKWLEMEPKNIIGIDSFSGVLLENKDAEKAYHMVKKVIWRASCDKENEILFIRARQLADYLGIKGESQWYQKQLDEFRGVIREWEYNEDAMLDEWFDSICDEMLWEGLGTKNTVPKAQEKKTYPNDPCPCGSGKKYKKCCGK